MITPTLTDDESALIRLVNLEAALNRMAAAEGQDAVDKLLLQTVIEQWAADQEQLELLVADCLEEERKAVLA